MKIFRTILNLIFSPDDYARGYDYAWAYLESAQTSDRETVIRNELWNLIEANNHTRDYLQGVMQALLEWECK